jgi:proline dehydrogenase
MRGFGIHGRVQDLFGVKVFLRAWEERFSTIQHHIKSRTPFWEKWSIRADARKIKFLN